ncbi:hypothetical protein EAE99_006700 [Botrytis elliptica]|nr:hypothetical protein EAE99_006700 [Botrytis elliptica]
MWGPHDLWWSLVVVGTLAQPGFHSYWLSTIGIYSTPTYFIKGHGSKGLRGETVGYARRPNLDALLEP